MHFLDLLLTNTRLAPRVPGYLKCEHSIKLDTTKLHTMWAGEVGHLTTVNKRLKHSSNLWLLPFEVSQASNPPVKGNKVFSVFIRQAGLMPGFYEEFQHLCFFRQFC